MKHPSRRNPTVGRNRIELWGEISRQPDIRSTPSGKPLLRLTVDCGETGEGLEMEVVLSGETGRELGASLKTGHQVRVVGALRAIWRDSRSGIRERQLEVVASEVERR
ncbi:MAG: single-stranded DNA-binding protein [Candidatus Binataceae bacterium]|jgi:single-stranded DNA-binding protein